jgi:hypothetical protein
MLCCSLPASKNVTLDWWGIKLRQPKVGIVRGTLSQHCIVCVVCRRFEVIFRRG